MTTMKKRPRILLIDQHPEWLDFAQGILKNDYEVIVNNSWKNLLSIGRDSTNKVERFDLVFIGQELATNNLDTLKPYFKQWHFVVVFPVIETNKTIRLLFKAGVYDCARKPYEKTGLLKLVSDELVAAKIANGDKKIQRAPSPLNISNDNIANKLASRLNLEEK